jgi:hypothetical protein
VCCVSACFLFFRFRKTTHSPRPKCGDDDDDHQLVDAGTDDSVPPQISEHMLLDSKQRNATRAGRSGSVGK